MVAPVTHPPPGQPFQSQRRNLVFSAAAWVFAIGLSLGLNLFLFGIMPGLIQSVPDRSDDLENIRAIQVVRVKRPEPPARKHEKSKPPKPKKTARPVKQVTRLSAPKPVSVKPKLPFELNPRLPKFSDSLDMPPLDRFSMTAEAPKGLYLSNELDGPLTPIVTVAPVYPLRASRLGIEGWVRISFDVTINGQVENIKILAAEPEGVFENAVVNCASQWRFKPGTVEGVAVAARAQTTIRFQLED